MTGSTEGMQRTNRQIAAEHPFRMRVQKKYATEEIYATGEMFMPLQMYSYQREIFMFYHVDYVIIYHLC